ncbi:MAG: NUDIX hydrolase [Pseudomonadota bacterium]
MAASDKAELISRRKPSGGMGNTGIRPRDAATLILVDLTGRSPRFLLGRRRSDLVFMPGRYVFPGGRSDPEDKLHPACKSLPKPLVERVLTRMTGHTSEARARALPITAIRETKEEAGITITDPTGLVLAARAITPPGPPRRYDTRFFIADAATAELPDDLANAGDGELEDLSWHDHDSVMAINTAEITRQIVHDTAERFSTGDPFDHLRPIPLYFYRHGAFFREMI